MKIALFSATGTIGQRILHEALGRGHQVTAIVRNPAKLTEENPNLTVVQGDIFDSEKVASLVAGHDAVASAYGPASETPEKVIDSVRSLIAGLTAAGVKRLVIVGGAGLLQVAPNLQLVDSKTFPQAWLGIANAHRDAYKVLQSEGDALDWSYHSPAALIEPGERTGTFRYGGDELVVDAEGNSRISAEDYAIAFVDEIETGEHQKQRFSVAYY